MSRRARACRSATSSSSRPTARTWSDAGLGCPVAGMNYIQVPVDGYQVVVEAGTVRYDYRGTGPGRFRLCTAAPG